MKWRLEIIWIKRIAEESMNGGLFIEDVLCQSK